MPYSSLVVHGFIIYTWNKNVTIIVYPDLLFAGKVLQDVMCRLVLLSSYLQLLNFNLHILQSCKLGRNICFLQPGFFLLLLDLGLGSSSL
jgi:hypothetical protein